MQMKKKIMDHSRTEVNKHGWWNNQIVSIEIYKEAVNTNLTVGLKGADKNVINAFV